MGNNYSPLEKRVREIRKELDEISEQLGDLSYLDTFEKEIVGAINEVNHNKQDSLPSGLNTDNKSIVGAINEVAKNTFDDGYTRGKKKNIVDLMMLGVL